MLASDRDNVHALSNLTRYLVLSGRLEDAAGEAERLKAAESDQPDLWVKKVEALSYLGDDRGVLDALEAAEQERAEFRTGDPMLYHLGAVAAMRLGQEKEARRYWKRALELAPGLEVAEENLEDLDNPVGEQHAPWPFDFANWVAHLGIVELVREAESVLESGDESALSRFFERYLHRHPEIAGIIPRLLDAGDPTGREFALRTAMTAHTPEMLAALKDFALGQRGPDELRMEAAQAVSEAGLLPSGPVRFWQRGEWREVRLVSYDIHDEPLTRHSAEVEQWHAEAHEALNEGDGERAERLLERALQIEPDDPSLLYNLSVAYTVQQRDEEAEALLRDLHRRDPDYLFARVGLARRYLQRGEIDEGKALLDPLRSRRRFHFAEFNVFCMAQIDLHLAEGNQEAAESWLDMWADSDPDYPALDIYRRRLQVGRRQHSPRSGLRHALFRRG